MSAAEYVIADPTGNITALVYTPVARPQQAETAEKIMAACRGLLGGRKTVKSKKSENNVFSRGSGVTSVTPFPLSSAHSAG